MEIKIYTDGACIGNPGPGGWAAIILTESGAVKKVVEEEVAGKCEITSAENFLKQI